MAVYAIINTKLAILLERDRDMAGRFEKETVLTPIVLKNVAHILIFNIAMLIESVKSTIFQIVI